MMKYLLLCILFVSIAQAEPYRITNLVQAARSSYTITLTCTVPKTKSSTLSGAEPVRKIELRISDVNITTANYDKCVLVQTAINPGVAGTKVTFVVEGLKPDTKYYFACRAFDTVWNDVSNSALTRTDPGPPPPADRTIRVKWYYDANDEGSIPFAVVIVHGPTPAMTEKAIAVRGTVDHVDIPNLKVGVPYYWQVITVNEDGDQVEGLKRSG